MKKIISLTLCVLMLLTLNTAFCENLSGYFSEEYENYALFSGEEMISGNTEGVLYPVGSISKIFTSALTLKLCEEGSLSLEGKVTEYLPGFTMKDERYKDITVLHLLNHTSGILGSSLKNVLLYNDADCYNHDNFLTELSGQRLKYTPGEMANYCNDGYTLLELIIEEITGMSYAEYLHSVFDSYLPAESLKTVEELSCYDGEYVNSAGAMGLYSTAETVSLASYIITSTDKILSEKSRELMMNSRDGALPGEYFGLGWDSVSAYPFDNYEIKALTKGGDTLTYHASVTVLPELGITACFIHKNGDSRMAEAKANALIIDYLSAKGINIGYDNAEKTDADIKEIPPELKKYEGLYLSSDEQLLFTAEGSYGTVKKLISGTETRLAYIGEGKFETDKGYMYFSEINGRTYMIQEGYADSGNGTNYKFFDYYAEKKDVSGNIGEEWKKRDGEVYLLCDEKYSSMLYMGKIPYTRIKFYENGGGYLSYLRLQSETLAECDIALPGSNGADLTDIEIVCENGKEYVKAHGNKYISLSDVPTIYGGESSVCTILPDGYTRWFKSGETGGRKITVKVNGEGMFALYNSNAECAYSSLKGETEFMVPEGGYIAFSGDAGTIFEISLA